MNEREFEYQHSIAVLIGCQSYNKLKHDDGKIMFEDINQAPQDMQDMEKGCKEMGFTEIKKFWEPKHTALKLFFTKLDAELLERQEAGENTVVFVYYTGHGLMDERSLIVVNDDSPKPKNAFMFPLERYLRTLSENPSNFIIAMFDCCRARVPKKFRNMLNADDEEEQEPSRNLMFIFGCAPTSVVNQKSPLAVAFHQHAAKARKNRGGQVQFPMDFVFFKTPNAKPEIVIDCTHSLDFPKDAAAEKKKEPEQTDLSEGLTKAFAEQKQANVSQGKTNGEMNTSTFKYKGDLLNGVCEGRGTLTFIAGASEGDSYTGDFKNNKFQGNGVYTYKTGKNTVKYEGQFADGKISGKGKMTYKNGDVADSMFKDGKCNGQGKCFKYNGDVYEGGFLDNYYHGKGKLTYKAGGFYEGDWQNGFATGKGKKHFQSGDVYTGDFVKGKPDGYGDCVYKNGNKYSGQWKQNTLTGKGKLTYANGTVYDGDWNANKKVTGHVTFKDGGEHWAQYQNDAITGPYKRKYPNGTILEGPVVNGKINGSGTYTFTSGKVWEGNFKDDLLQGDGYVIHQGKRTKVIFKDNKIDKEIGEEAANRGKLTTQSCWYEGELVDGKANGHGTLVYTSGEFEGDKYVGQMKNNRFNGQGTYTFKEGKNQKTYVGKFLDGAMTGWGKMTYKNGDVAEAEFKGGKCNGSGKCWKYNGDLYEGGFKNNFYHGKGKLTYKAGGYYNGDWKDGFATGNAEKMFQSGDYYKGEFIKGKPDGYGECKYKNGNRYEGNWKQNTLTGQGTLYYKSGTVYTGTWNGNKRVKGHVKFTDGGEHWGNYENEKLVGDYKRKYPNGTILEGPVVNGKINGKGSYTFVSGTKWEGNFTDDLLQGQGVKIVKGERINVTFKDNKIVS